MGFWKYVGSGIGGAIAGVILFKVGCSLVVHANNTRLKIKQANEQKQKEGK